MSWYGVDSYAFNKAKIVETPKPIDYLDPDFQNVIEADDIALKEELNKVKLLEVTPFPPFPPWLLRRY